MWEIFKFLLAVFAFCGLVSLACAVYMIYCKAMFFVFVLAVFALCHACFNMGRASVSNHGAGADSVRTQLDSAGATASAVTGGLREAERTAQEAENTTHRIESTVRDSGNAISNCKQILRAVRQRGKVEAITN